MLNKIIKELEAKIAEYDILTDVIKDVSYEKERFVLKYAISIIKKHESEFEDKRIKNAIAYINGGLDGAEFNGVDEIYGKSQVVEILNDIKNIGGLG